MRIHSFIRRESVKKLVEMMQFVCEIISCVNSVTRYAYVIIERRLLNICTSKGGL